MYRGNLSVINWWFALCQAVWWCLWLYVLGFSSEGIRLIVFTDSSSGNVGCFINNSSSYTEWSVVQMQNLITSEVLAGNEFNREQNVGRLHLWWIRWCNIYDSTLIFSWFLVRNCSHFINSKKLQYPIILVWEAFAMNCLILHWKRFKQQAPCQFRGTVHSLLTKSQLTMGI